MPLNKEAKTMHDTERKRERKKNLTAKLMSERKKEALNGKKERNKNK